MNTNPNAKRIVCYGDSNTWGQKSFKKERLPSNIRWTGKLQDLLGNDFEIIEEGVCARTFKSFVEEKSYRSGLKHLHTILDTNLPYECVVIMLGTNDLKAEFNLTPKDINNHLIETLELISKVNMVNNNKSEIIIICPAIPSNHINSEARFSEAPQKASQLDSLFSITVNKYKCKYINLDKLVDMKESPDGYHLTEAHHEKLAEEVYKVISKRKTK